MDKNIYFPGGKKKAFTLSYDDGVTTDRRLIEIFNKYNLKATFNLNSGIQTEQNNWINGDTIIKRMNQSDIGSLYDGHEIAIHTLTHPNLTVLSKEDIKKEVLQDKINLEKIYNCAVTGMAYPFGTYNDTVIEVLLELRIAYSRTVEFDERFTLPKNPLMLGTTCHHNNPKLFELANEFITLKDDELSMFYIWGHSYEFDVKNNWDMIEEFCKLISGRDDIWYATNIEIIDFLNSEGRLNYGI